MIYEDSIEPTQNINDLSMQEIDEESLDNETRTWGYFYSLAIGFDATGTLVNVVVLIST